MFEGRQEGSVSAIGLAFFEAPKTYDLGVADKAASLMGCESPTANCPIRAVSISDVWRGNELYDARK